MRGVDLKFHEYAETEADDFIIGDLRDPDFCRACDRHAVRRGLSARRRHGRGRLHLHRRARRRHHAQLGDDQPERARRLPQAQHQDGSSIPPRPACIRPTTRRIPTIPNCSEDSAYPAAPDSEYGWEKLFSERLYLAYSRNYGMNDRSRALSQHLRSGGHLGRRPREGAGGDLPQGRERRRRRRDRDLGRRQADALVPLYRRMRGGDAAADALGLRRVR